MAGRAVRLSVAGVAGVVVASVTPAVSDHPGVDWTGSAKTLAGIPRHAGLQLAAQQGVIQLLADQDQLVAAIGWGAPVAVVDGEAFTRQMKHMPPFTFVEPEDAFGTEHAGGQLVVEEVLEFAQGEGAIAAE